MIREGWDVISRCPACGLMMRTDLQLIGRETGAGISLWNRRAPCRRLLCAGKVEFWAKPRGGGAHEPLMAP
jgi:hypothetical protein